MKLLYNINGFIRDLPADHKCGIRQDFAVATPSLTPRLSFFPLWMLFAANAGGLSFYIGGSLPPPAGQSACLPPLHRAVGASM